MITITLPKHNFSLPLEKKLILDKFPDSLLGKTLELTSDKEIPLDHELITPDVLILLYQLLHSKDLPYIDDENMFKALDYLCINLSSEGRYSDLKLNKYQMLLEMAHRSHSLPMIEQLFGETNSGDYTPEDCNFLDKIIVQSPLSSLDEKIATLIIKERDLTSGHSMTRGIIKSRSRNLLHTYMDKYLPKGIMYHFSYQIHNDWLHYETYLMMMDHVSHFFTGSDERDYHMLQSCITSNLDEVRGLPRVEYGTDHTLSYIATHIALLRGHYEVVRIMFGRYKYYYDHPHFIMDRCKLDTREFFDNIREAYIKIGKVIPEGMKLLVDIYKHVFDTQFPLEKLKSHPEYVKYI